jgi:hypothetical protein
MIGLSALAEFDPRALAQLLDRCSSDLPAAITQGIDDLPSEVRAIVNSA